MRRMRRLLPALGLVLDLAPAAARADETAPADTLMDMRRAIGACLARTPLAAGSRVTIRFMMKRDGSVFGRPHLAWSHLEGDAEAQRRFLAAAVQAVDSCLPASVTPALGAAIAGRMFTITIGRESPDSRA